MANQPPKREHLMNGPEAAALLKNKDAVMGLLTSPDAQKLMQLLNESGGNGLKTAADAALKGDTHLLVGLMETLMKNKEGAAVVERISQSIPQK